MTDLLLIIATSLPIIITNTGLGIKMILTLRLVNTTINVKITGMLGIKVPNPTLNVKELKENTLSIEMIKSMKKKVSEFVHNKERPKFPLYIYCKKELISVKMYRDAIAKLGLSHNESNIRRDFIRALDGRSKKWDIESKNIKYDKKCDCGANCYEVIMVLSEYEKEINGDRPNSSKKDERLITARCVGMVCKYRDYLSKKA